MPILGEIQTPDFTGSGTITANGQSVAIAIGAGQTTWSVDLRGTFSAGTTIQFEGSVDGTNYTTILGTSFGDATATQTTSIAGGAARIYFGSCVGLASVRVKSTAFQGGDSVTVTMRAASGAVLIQVSGPAVTAASTAPTAAQPALNVALSPNSAAVPVLTAPATSTPGVAFGDVSTNAGTEIPVRRTTYTEQASGAQRSLSSTSASDASAGTGIQQVTVTWYTSAGAGPNTEVVTLNGTTPVAMVATTVCFIEKMVGTRVGSAGVAAGTITLFINAAGGGGTIGTIGIGANQTFWAHHYVPTGKTCNVTGITASSNSTVVGGGALFTLRSRTIGVATAPELQVGTTLRVYGQSSSVSRLYASNPDPVRVVGPARLIVYVAPESSSNFVQRASIDYYDA